MKLKASERQAILQSLQNGVVPRVGLQHILVGREQELSAIAKDIALVAQGGATMRFVVGDYGAGKTFFLNLVKLIALQKGLVVMNADVTNERRLRGSGGQALNLFSELTRNLSTRSRPEGGAMKSVIERFIADAAAESEKTERSTREVIRSRLSELSELVSGFDFADVLNAYYEGYEAQDEDRQQAALKWLRGEYSSKLEARKALGVRSMVDDDSVYDYLKLFARFLTLSGYRGLIVCLDEMASIHSLSSAQARNQNYEQLLRILNDVHQGSADHLGLILGGTVDFMEDTRRGVFSYDALRTRLSPNLYARRQGLVDFSQPVMPLSQLTRDDLLKLLTKIRSIKADGADPVGLLDDAGLSGFIELQLGAAGAAAFLTPREAIRQFVHLLSVLEQNPGVSWQTVVGAAPMRESGNIARSQMQEGGSADLESFRL